MKHIGFIGASGLMGHGIAKNLLAKGFQVSLTAHSKQEPLKDLIAAGAVHEFLMMMDQGYCSE